MKILKIKIHQDKANYGMAETVEHRMTYPLPFFSTVIGALFSSCHLDRGIDIDVSVQGSYQAMSSEIRIYTVYLNAFAKDRGKMVYTPNPDILYGPIVAVGKEKEFDFIKNENVTVVDKPLYGHFCNIIEQEKMLMDERKRLTTLEKERRAELKAQGMKLKDIRKEISDLTEKIQYNKETLDLIRLEKGKFRTVVKIPRRIQMLNQIDLIIHVRTDDKSAQKIKKNIGNLTALGRSRDFIELVELKETTVEPFAGKVNLKGKMYVNRDDIELKPGTVFWVNKDYTIVDERRVFNEIPCFLASDFVAVKNVYRDEDGDFVNFN